MVKKVKEKCAGEHKTIQHSENITTRENRIENLALIIIDDFTIRQIRNRKITNSYANQNASSNPCKCLSKSERSTKNI